MIRADLLIEGSSEVVTCASPAGSALRGTAQGDAGVIPGGVVACLGERIVFVGSSEEARRLVALDADGRRLDARGGTVLPGFIDPHTHLPFAGWRADEFEQRLAGATYEQIAAGGGGILATVRATREIGAKDLASIVRERLDDMLAAGTTTVEAKSGYGLSAASEMEILRALALAADHPVEIVTTFLGAHTIAPEYRGENREEYVRLLVEDMLPRIAGEGLADFCDAFIDTGAFTIDEGRRVLEAARALGFGLRVHAEQLSRTGAAALGVSLGAHSVDHLERASAEDVRLLAEAWRTSEKTGAGSRPRRAPVAVLLPGPAIFLRQDVRPPARALIDSGVPVALATDFNPGTSPCLAMPPMLHLACLLFGMTPEETIIAATRNAAASLGIAARVGSLTPGMQADIAVWGVPDRRHLAYRFGPIPCRIVLKRGRIAALDGRLAPRGGPPALSLETSMLVDLPVDAFLDRLASSDPTPGGGSASALAAAQSAALLEMVIALTLKGEKYAASRPALEPIAARAAAHRAELARLIDRDAQSYEAVIAANRLPRETAEEKEVRKDARDKALRFAAEVPLATAEQSAALAELAAEAAPHINPNAASDLLVSGLLAQAALGGAAANVRINLSGLKSEEFSARANEKLDRWTDAAAAATAAIRARFAGAV